MNFKFKSDVFNELFIWQKYTYLSFLVFKVALNLRSSDRKISSLRSVKDNLLLKI